MIVVDSSVWIASLRNDDSFGVRKLNFIVDTRSILVGDVILLEVLRGARNEAHAARLERNLRRFVVAPMLDADLAKLAAMHYRRLRDLGVTIRKTVDLIIGTFCIARGHSLLEHDRDFQPMAQHLGLHLY